MGARRVQIPSEEVLGALGKVMIGYDWVIFCPQKQILYGIILCFDILHGLHGLLQETVQCVCMCVCVFCVVV